jgi:hypothetical protein
MRLVLPLLLSALLSISCGSDSTDSQPTGASCTFGMQCEGEVCITEFAGSLFTGWPDGMCTDTCAHGTCSEDSVCSDLGDGLYCLPACTSIDDCRSGYVCHQHYKACYPHCKQIGCQEGWLCSQDGQCHFNYSLSPSGFSCSSDSDCTTGACLPALIDGEFTGWHGGMCFAYCTSTGCDEDSTCVILDEIPYCLPTCTSQSTCREGYICSTSHGACLPDCSLGWDCGPGFLCLADGSCAVDWPELQEVGEPCKLDAECITGWCLEAESDSQSTGWESGTCTIPCGPGGQCPTGSKCMVLDEEGWCLPNCFGPPDSPDCRDQYICDPFTHVCLPNCHNDGWDCTNQYNCNPQGVCAPF